MKKNFRELERVVRGFSNHRRIEIMELLSRRPEMALVDIADTLDINMKTAHEHVRRLALTGLVSKYNYGNAVRHKLTRTGSVILKFLRTLE